MDLANSFPKPSNEMKKLLLVFLVLPICLSGYSQYPRGETPIRDLIQDGTHYTEYNNIGEWTYFPEDYSLVRNYSLSFNANTGAYSMVVTILLPYQLESLDVYLHVGSTSKPVSYYLLTNDKGLGYTSIVLPLTGSFISEIMGRGNYSSCYDTEGYACYCESFFYVEDPNKGIYFIVYPYSQEWFTKSLNRIYKLNSFND